MDPNLLSRMISFIEEVIPGLIDEEIEVAEELLVSLEHLESQMNEG